MIIAAGNNQHRNPVFEFGKVTLDDANIPLHRDLCSCHGRESDIGAGLFYAQRGEAVAHILTQGSQVASGQDFPVHRSWRDLTTVGLTDISNSRGWQGIDCITCLYPTSRYMRRSFRPSQCHSACSSASVSTSREPAEDGNDQRAADTNQSEHDAPIRKPVRDEVYQPRRFT